MSGELTTNGEGVARFPRRSRHSPRGSRRPRGSSPDRPVPDGEWGPTGGRPPPHRRRGRGLAVTPRLLAAEDRPHWPWTEPGLAPGFDGVPLDDVLAAFATARAATTATVRALDEAGWARSGTHDTYGVLDVEGLLRIAIDHDADHLEGLATID